MRQQKKMLIEEHRNNPECKSEDSIVICDHAEVCTQRLVVCDRQTEHNSKYFCNMCCTGIGYCAVAELDCKCVEVRKK